MRHRNSFSLGAAALVASTLTVTAAGNPVAVVPPAVAPSAVAANDNRTPAGTYVGDTLVLRLTVATVAWHFLGENDPALTVAAFAEEGKTPTIPGPLLRVRTGTPIHVMIRNTVNDTLIVRGFSERNPSVDSLILLPQTTREVTFSREKGGTYQYWATLAEWQRNVPLPLKLHKHGLMRPRFDSQLTGAFIVDPPGPIPKDRIFVISETVDQAPPIRDDSRGMPGREFTAINGRSWPYTERLHYSVGDTIHWRIINATFQSHPMHLHGFYFRVDASGNAEANVDSVYEPSQRRMVVTEVMKFGGDTRNITWSADRPGNWIFHCHLASHNAKLPSVDDPNEIEYPEHDHGDPDQHAMTGMNGLILGITVDGKVERAPSWHAAKRLRLFVQSDSVAGDSARRWGYVLQRGAEPRGDSVESPGPVLLLTRGEPTSIEVTNRTPEPTSVHWHGIELESYYDGVAGWSGRAGATEPAIRPGSTFEVHITPRRAGTFMYHTHFDDMRQQYGGLVGPIVVLEPGEHWDADRELLFMISDGPHASLRVNGSASPPPRVLKVGTTYRIRVADIAIYHQHIPVRLVRDSSALTWRAVAKDGFTLPPQQATVGPSATFVGSGETADFEFTPDAPGDLSLEVDRAGPYKSHAAILLHVVAK
ncbi:MAG TPA: multicopper oxidase domain-containing protein [Gemmatimonadaceae bacterium]|nr:multicopper oxidase domain-containing protein [Gemmatimonadaceae bacterium]